MNKLLRVTKFTVLVAILLGATNSAHSGVLFEDDFTGPLTWNTSDSSVYIKDNILYIGSDGGYDDWAEKILHVNLSHQSPVVIEQRLKLTSGGNNYVLPWQTVYFENGWEVMTSASISSQDIGSWIFTERAPGGPWSTGNTENTVPGEEYWAVTRMVLTPTGGKLYAKPDDAARGWVSDQFNEVGSATWSHSSIESIRFHQPWDSVNYVDYVKVTALTTPAQPDPCTFVDPAPSSATNVVFMVHGWKDSPTLFTTDDENDLEKTNMAVNIRNELLVKVITDWDVRTYNWSGDAAISTNDLLVMGPLGLKIPSPRAKRAAASQGRTLAHQILNDPNYNKKTDADVHLIAHSLGGRVIDEAARVLDQAGWNGKVHLTFLDAYTPDGWENSFGEKAAWAEHYYYDDGLIVNTQDDFNFARNVDITEFLDPRGSIRDNHKWPVRWYDSTIGENEGYGFPTSMEGLDSGELWSSPILYPSSADLLATSNMHYVNPVDQTINTSPTGTIHSEYLESGHVTLGTGSPVWINLDLTTDDVTNFLEFDFEFTEDADGLLSVYLDDELLGLFYERFALDGQQNSGILFFEDDLEAGFHVLAFRVDPLTDATSFVTLSGIEAGYMTVVPEPSTFALLTMGVLGLLAFARRSGQGNTNFR